MKGEYKKLIIIVLCTILCIVLSSYSVKYIYNRVDPLNSDKILGNWNYIKTSLQVTLMTLFVGISSGLYIRLKELEPKKNVEIMDVTSMIGAFIFYMPFLILLFYPGRNVLNMSSYTSGYKSIIGFLVVNGVFYYLIIKLIKNDIIPIMNYISLLAFAIILILIIPFLPFG